MLRNQFRKNYVKVYVPLFLFLLPILITVFLPQQLLHFIHVTYIFPFSLLLILFFSVGNTEITSSLNRKLPFGLWLAAIIGIELAISLVFFNQASIALENMLLLNYLSTNDTQAASQLLLQIINYNGAFFPWSMVAAVAAAFAIFSKSKKSLHTFSQPFPQEKNNHFWRLMRRTIDAYLETMGRIFIASCLGFIAIQITDSFTINDIIYNVNVALIISMILIFILKTHKLQLFLTKWDTGEINPGKVLLQMLVIIVLVTTVISYFTIPIFSHPVDNQAFVKNLIEIIVNKVSWQTIWQLWVWSWWILATGFAASLLVKISAGRSVRTLIIGAMVLPLMIWSLQFKEMVDLNSYLTLLAQDKELQMVLSVLSIFFIVVMFSQRDSHNALWLGFFPVVLSNKKRVVPSKTMWTYCVCLMSLLLIFGLFASLIINMLFAIASFLIFISMLKVNYFRRLN